MKASGLELFDTIQKHKKGLDHDLDASMNLLPCFQAEVLESAAEFCVSAVPPRAPGVELEVSAHPSCRAGFHGQGLETGTWNLEL